LSQSHNWLGDSKPNFPAQISGFLYAQFYATPVKGTRFGIFALGECPRWRHRIVADLVLSGRAPRSCSRNFRGDSGLRLRRALGCRGSAAVPAAAPLVFRAGSAGAWIVPSNLAPYNPEQQPSRRRKRSGEPRTTVWRK
jgi:hypothetical protein